MSNLHEEVEEQPALADVWRGQDFYWLKAFTEVQHRELTTQCSTRQRIHRRYIEDTYAEAYKLAFDTRMSADYEGKIDIDDEMAEHIVRSAEKFVRKAYEVLEQIEQIEK